MNLKINLFFFLFVLCEISLGAKTVNRIVCLSPAGAEIVCSVGAMEKIVARSEYCDFPASLQKIEVVGGFEGKSLSVEKILSYRPDFVYGVKGMHEFLEPILKSLGVTVFLSDCKSIDDILDEITYVASLLNRKESGKRLRAEIAGKLESLQNSNNSSGLKIYYEVWNVPFMSAGNLSFINSIIQVAGGKNIFDDINAEYPLVSQESIIVRNPDVILIPNLNGETFESVANRSGWKRINAVKNGKIYFVDSDIFSRPGPRVVNAVEELQKICKGL